MAIFGRMDDDTQARARAYRESRVASESLPTSVEVDEPVVEDAEVPA